MDATGYPLRRSSSSSDRLLHPLTSPTATLTTAADDLNEADLFWSADSSEPENQRTLPSPADIKRRRHFDRLQNSGILSALTEPDHAPVFRRNPSSSSSASMTVPSLRRPPSQNSEYVAQSVPSRMFQQSAPVKVPMLSSKCVPRRRNAGELAIVDDGDDDDNEMLPPHEIVARGSGVSPNITFSVLEGVGRTLKGRDLRQVRNAIWRKTGFLD